MPKKYVSDRSQGGSKKRAEDDVPLSAKVQVSRMIRSASAGLFFFRVGRTRLSMT